MSVVSVAQTLKAEQNKTCCRNKKSQLKTMRLWERSVSDRKRCGVIKHEAEHTQRSYSQVLRHSDAQTVQEPVVFIFSLHSLQ